MMTRDRTQAVEAGEELSERQRQVLAAVVREHIRTTCPVGSKALARRYGLAVSSATIRNEMAELDRMGYLHQPHTSAGRVPSQKAYRFHVNHLEGREDLSIDKVSWIHSQYRRVELDPDKILRMSTKLLADIVKHPAVALEPGSEQDQLVDIQARSVSAHTVRIMCIYADGQGQEFVVRSAESITAEQVEQLGGVIKDQLAAGLSARAPREDTGGGARGLGISADLLRAVHRQLWARAGGRIYIDGAAYILQQPEFQELPRLRELVETLGEHQALCELLCMADEGAEVSVVIGSEHAIARLEQCSSVMSSFAGPSNCRGIVGVLGPMRMRYREVISTVDCVARQVGQVLARSESG